MSKPMAHLSEWTLEQMAEGMLPEPEHRDAMTHVERCTRCAAELEGFRALFSALSQMPRFAPSPQFTEAVMARVQVAPRASPAMARMRRWLPVTRRGWMLLSLALVAPALPVIAGMAWLLSQPLVSAAALGQWLSLQANGLAQATVARLGQWEASLGLAARGRSVYAALLDVPPELLVAGLVVMAVGIPLSAWSLVRLVRAPTGNMNYAN